MTEKQHLDDELGRLLEIAGQRLPIETSPAQPVQASVWPWQVPQVPTFTTDQTPMAQND